MRVWWRVRVLSNDWLVMYWMFRIWAERATWKVFSPSLSLPLILCFSDICQWNSSVQRPLFIHFHISPPAFHHSPPPRWMWHCVCHKRTAADKKKKGGAQNCENGTGQDFLSLWMKPWHPECSTDKISEPGGECLSVCLTPCESIWLPFANREPRQRQRELSVPASLKDLALLTRLCVCVWMSVCAVVLHVYHCSFFQFSQEILCSYGSGNTLRSSLYFVTVLGNSNQWQRWTW